MYANIKMETRENKSTKSTKKKVTLSSIKLKFVNALSPHHHSQKSTLMELKASKTSLDFLETEVYNKTKKKTRNKPSGSRSTQYRYYNAVQSPRSVQSSDLRQSTRSEPTRSTRSKQPHHQFKTQAYTQRVQKSVLLQHTPGTRRTQRKQLFKRRIHIKKVEPKRRRNSI